MPPLTGQRVTVMGLGRFGGGVGVTRYLVSQGAQVLVTDTGSAASLAASVEQLSGLPGITYRLGEHRESDFTGADLVVANPAVKPGDTYLAAARDAGVPITTELRLLVERLPNRQRTIGITGSAGKSTITAMIGYILEKAIKQKTDEVQIETEHPIAGPLRGPDPHPKVFLGGNLGGSLLQQLDQITADDWIVLELSSFMLHYLRPSDTFAGWSPHIAVVTNLSPNHLDWHGSFDAYRADKQVILDHQHDDQADAAVCGPGVRAVVTPRVKRCRDFDPAGESRDPYESLLPLKIPGQHNQLNARLAAAAVQFAIGMPEYRGCELLADFPGLPYRLQFVAERGGVRFYNDSKSTTPESARLAIDAFPEGTTHIILGGYDKGSDLTPLAEHAATRCAGIYTIGKTGDTIADAATRATHGPPTRPDTCGGVAWPPPSAEVVRCGDLDTAVQQAITRAKPGQVVLLSPACASWGQYENFEQRGDHFTRLVTAIPARS